MEVTVAGRGEAEAQLANVGATREVGGIDGQALHRAVQFAVEFVFEAQAAVDVQRTAAFKEGRVGVAGPRLQAVGIGVAHGESLLQ